LERVFTELHCMQVGLVARKVSVRLSVCLANAWIVTRFLYQYQFEYQPKGTRVGTGVEFEERKWQRPSPTSYPVTTCAPSCDK